jgi:steroid 5-alpha reductase family enzyme
MGQSEQAITLMGVITLAVAGWMLAAAVMALLWAWHLRRQNAGIVDVGWTALVAGLAILDARLGDGWEYRRAAFGFMMGSWGLRLAVYLLYDRVLNRPEDGRYVEMRRDWGAEAPRRFFWFFQTQALAAVGFSLPALFASTNREPRFSIIELVAAGLWVVAFAGESTADRQLLRFKSNAANRGRTCRTGLWKWSRHPNYFFEWLIWIAFALFAAASPWGWIAFACPAAMLYFLLKVTGIPLNEAQALRSRGDEYREYQRSTSAFVPWFPRSS